MSSQQGSYDTTGANVGMGIGGTIAAGLMIVSLVLLIRELRRIFKNGWPSSRPKPPPLRTPTSPVPPTPVAVPPVKSACLLPSYKEYLRSLNLDLYFEQKCDCYCIKCFSNSRKTNERGGYSYTIPHGWVRFRIRTEQILKQEKHIFQQWATTYYPICEENLERILRNRPMPFPGDELLDGTKFKDHSPDGRNCFTSPSIDYASNWQRGPTKRFTLSDGTVYNVRMILQCKQKPGTFIVQRGRSGLCNIIPTDVIEWKSNQRATIVPIGLMIQMTKA